MADQRSIEMLAFNFASRTFAYKRLAQGLSRAVSAFSSFMREYLDKVIKADQCAQYVDDIGIAANSATQLIRNIRAVFVCIRRAGLKLTIEKCDFGVTEVEFLGRTITPQGIASRILKFRNSWQMWDSQNEKNRYKDTSALLNTIATASRDCLKNCLDSTNCWKQTSKSNIQKNYSTITKRSTQLLRKPADWLSNNQSQDDNTS